MSESPRILLIDDEKPMRKRLRSSLANQAADDVHQRFKSTHVLFLQGCKRQRSIVRRSDDRIIIQENLVTCLRASK